MIFDHRRGFTPRTFYRFGRHHAREATASRLDFWDLICAYTDPTNGVVSIHIQRHVTRRKILSRPTFYNLMRRACASGELVPYEDESVHTERGEYLLRRTDWPRSDTFWKARGYVAEGWIAIICNLTAKQMLNLFYAILSSDPHRRASDALPFNLSELRRASGDVLNVPLSHRALRKGVVVLEEIGVVERNATGSQQPFRFSADRLQQPSPSRENVAGQIALLTQLTDPDDLPWIRLLTDFVQRAGYRVREVPTIYNYLLHALPDTSPAMLGALRQELLHHLHWGGMRYRAVVSDFLKKTYSQGNQVSLVASQRLSLRYAPGKVVASSVQWPADADWQEVVSVSVACDVKGEEGNHRGGEHGTQRVATWPRVFLWWRGKMCHVGRFTPKTRRGVRQRRRFDLTRLLPGIRPDEPLSLVVAADADASPGCLRATLILGVRSDRGRTG